MKTFDIDCKLVYEVNGAAEFFFQIEAARIPEHTILSESFEVTPSISVPREYLPPNSHNRSLRVHAQAGTTSIIYRARVVRRFEEPDHNAPELSISELPDEVMQYLLPTRYCESDILSGMAQRTFGGAAARLRSAWKPSWPGSANTSPTRSVSPNVTTTARDVLANRAGVCRDFAHVAITMCRALNIPARFVVGYVEFEEPPPDFHAIFEAYLGGKWILFDPTGLAPVENVVRIASGPDAMDVAFATIYGPARMTDIQPNISQVFTENVVQQSSGAPVQSSVQLAA